MHSPETILLDALADAVGSLEAIPPEQRTMAGFLQYLEGRVAARSKAEGLPPTEEMAVRRMTDRFAVSARHYRNLRNLP